MDIETLKKTVLFRNMSESEVSSALYALTTSERTYSRDEVILHAGDKTDDMGLVLDGSVRIESNDIWATGPSLVMLESGRYSQRHLH